MIKSDGPIFRNENCFATRTCLNKNCFALNENFFCDTPTTKEETFFVWLEGKLFCDSNENCFAKLFCDLNTGWVRKNDLCLWSHCFILSIDGVLNFCQETKHLMAILYLKGFCNISKSSCSPESISNTHFFEKWKFGKYWQKRTLCLLLRSWR